MSNKQVKKERVKVKILLYLLDYFSTHPENISYITKKLKWSKQRMNYWLSKMVNKGYIEKLQSYPYAIYDITDKGVQVKKILGQSEGARQKSLWRCHALIVGFPIENWGIFDIDNMKNKKNMKNWFYVEDTITDSIGNWKIQIQSTGLLKIYCPEIYGDDPKSHFGAMYERASQIAIQYRINYQMGIGRMKVIREGHKELINSDNLANIFGTAKVDNVWIDNSTGSLNLEESQSSDKLEKLLELPDMVQQLGQGISMYNESIEMYNKNIELHLSAIQEMKDTMSQMREYFKKLNNKD